MKVLLDNGHGENTAGNAPLNGKMERNYLSGSMHVK